MSTAPVICPNCREEFEVSADHVGRNGRCGSCQHKFLLEAAPRPIAVPVARKSWKLPVFLIAVVLALFGGWLVMKKGRATGEPEVKVVLDSRDEREADLGPLNSKSREVEVAPPVPEALLRVSEGSSFKPSPVKTQNQWEYARVYETYPNAVGMFPLFAGNAALFDAAGKPGSGQFSYKLERDSIQSWLEEKSRAVWKLAPVLRGTSYDVYLQYGAPAECVGNRFTLTVGEQSIEVGVEDTGGYQKFKMIKVGELVLVEGRDYEVELLAQKVNANTGLFDLRGIEIVPKETAHRWFDVVTGEWTRAVPQSMRYAGGKTTDPAPPAHLIEGGPKGYAIITTKAIAENSKVLPRFIEHKTTLGYQVMVVTEDDFGGGTGPDASDRIRKWLHENYQEREILYVLLIGDPNPSSGEIPMTPLATDMREFRQKIAAGEHPHSGRPSDSVYMDVSGASMDFNGDGTYGGGGDYVAERGLDSVWDVLVGRINYYGEDSAWGKYADVDAILQKTINYENASAEEILERYHFEIDGNTLDGHVAEWGGFSYVTREQSYRGRLTLDHFSWQNNSFMDQYNVGFLRSGGHANPTFIESGVTSGWLANRVSPKDTLNVVAVYGGCDCSQPEHPMNMGYLHLRKGAIATAGASRSIAGVGGHGGLVRPSVFHSIRTTPLKRGISLGQAHWQGLTGGKRMPNGGAQMWTLYGDPSVVPFPRGLRPQRSHTIRPVHGLERYVSLANVESAALSLQEYDIQNLSDESLTWSANCGAQWAELSASSGSLKPGEIATLTLTATEDSRKLPVGRHRAIIELEVGEKIEQRVFEYVVYAPELAMSRTFDDKENQMLKPKRDGRTKLFDRFDFDDFIDRSISFEIASEAPLKEGTRILEGVGFQLKVGRDQTLLLEWEAYPYGENAWSKRFLEFDRPTLRLATRNGLRVGKRNRITIATDYEQHTLTIYLNGKQGEQAKMERHLFLPWKTDFHQDPDAFIDNVYVFNRSTDADRERAIAEQGFPVQAPEPGFHQKGVNRMVTLSWQPLSSSASVYQKARPRYRIYLGAKGEPLNAIATVSGTEHRLAEALAARTTYQWRIDTLFGDDQPALTGDLWEFTTGKTISREIFAQPLLADKSAWTSKWPMVGWDSETVVSFKGNGHNLTQKVDAGAFRAGGYRLTLEANSREEKPTKPMEFLIQGKDEKGEQVVFHQETLELNDLENGQLHHYFQLPMDLTNARDLVVTLKLPGGNGRRCPYWVFATKLSLMNNIDFSSLPNRAPRFSKAEIELPRMPAKDNSYAFEFRPLVSDEDPESLRFRMVEGPSWITVQESGRVFSYYGAPLEMMGKHRMKVEVTDQDGLSAVIFANLQVHQPGHLILPATEAVLSSGKEIRFKGNRITHIIQDDATATWNFTPAVSGKYRITLYAGTPDDNEGKISVNGNERTFPVRKTGGYANDQPHEMGVFTLTKGQPTTLTLGVARRVDGLCDVSRIELSPIE